MAETTGLVHRIRLPTGSSSLRNTYMPSPQTPPLLQTVQTGSNHTASVRGKEGEGLLKLY